MERHLMSKLVDWKNSRRKKPIIINGARQVGKTWLLKEFGAQHFDNVAYVNFDNNEAMNMLFEESYDSCGWLASGSWPKWQHTEMLDFSSSVMLNARPKIETN